jgi:hypothetical protein
LEVKDIEKITLQTMPKLITDDPFFPPYIDEMKNALSVRFTSHKNTLSGLQHLVPSHAIKATFEDVQPAFITYKDDLENSNLSIFKAEWEMWVSKWQK